MTNFDFSTGKKFDFKKVDKEFYSGKVGHYDDVIVPPMQYLAIDGEGAPGCPDHARAIVALYSLSYPAKFWSKNEKQRDYVVGPLEGLWWADDMSAYTTGKKDDWKWTMMIRQPEWLSEDVFDRLVPVAKAKLAKKKEPQTDEATLDKLCFKTLSEGLSVQILHVGPFADEGPVLEKLHKEVVPERGYEMTGKHHEIYLSDFRRAAPEKLRTILRQPVRQR